MGEKVQIGDPVIQQILLTRPLHHPNNIPIMTEPVVSTQFTIYIHGNKTKPQSDNKYLPIDTSLAKHDTFTVL